MAHSHLLHGGATRDLPPQGTAPTTTFTTPLSITIFIAPQENKIEVHMEEIMVNKEEIHKLLGELEEGKAVGPDGVSGYI